MNEVKISSHFLISVLSEKKTKLLRFVAYAKLKGHRAEIKGLLKDLKIHPKTGKRLIKQAVNDGLAGVDKKFLFPRSWRKLGINKRGGLYLTHGFTWKKLEKFEAICFAHALKKVIRKGNPHANKRSVLQEGFPTGFYCKALGIRERRFKSLKAAAQRYRFITVTPQVKIIGGVREFDSLRKNLPGLPIFKRGKFSVVPDISIIKVKI